MNAMPGRPARPKDPAEGIRIIRSAIDRGINFMDNCWDYHDGESEIRMGNALRDGYRQKVFLMSKFDGRTKTLTPRQIDESLKRLQTDYLDLMQSRTVAESRQGRSQAVGTMSFLHSLQVPFDRGISLSRRRVGAAFL